MNKVFKYKCMDCGHILIGDKDGLRCTECNGPIAPIGEASKDEYIRFKSKSGKECGHKYIHLDTTKNIKDHSPGYCKTWTKIDRFFCEKCLKIKEIKQEHCGVNKPEWYY